MSDVYPSVLGEQYAELSPVVRELLQGPTRKAVGTMEFVRGKGVMTSILLHGLGLPTSQGCVDAELVIEPIRGGELWIRTFAGQVYATKQVACGKWIREFRRLVSIDLLPIVRDGALHFASGQGRIAGIPLPNFLVIDVKAQVYASEMGWYTEVCIRHPWFGVLVSYRGQMRWLS